MSVSLRPAHLGAETTRTPRRSRATAGPWFFSSFSGTPSMEWTSWKTHSCSAAHLPGDARKKSSTYAFWGTLKMRRSGCTTHAATLEYCPERAKGGALWAYARKPPPPFSHAVVAQQAHEQGSVVQMHWPLPVHAQVVALCDHG